MAGKKKQGEKESSSKLRAEAESKVTRSAGKSAVLKKIDTDKLVHELQIHQVELEMQNEELRRTQEQLQASKEQYFELYDMAPVGYFSLSEQGIILEANLTGASMLGVAPRDLRGKRFSSLIFKADQDVYYLHRRQLFDTREPQACEMRMARRDGSLLWARIEASLAQDSRSGKTICLATMSDITNQRKSVEDLRESEEKYHTVADFTYDWEYWLSPEGQFIYVSPSCKIVTGYEHEAFMHDPDLMLKIIHPDDRESLVRHRKESSDPHISSNPLDFRIITRDGEERWISHICQKVYGADGKDLGVRGSNRDITNRKISEQALEESEHKYRLLADNTSDGIWLLDMYLNLTYCSPSSATQSGFTIREIIDMSLEQYFSPESLKIVADMFMREMPKVQSDPDYNPLISLDLEFYKKDSTTFWAESKFSVIRDKNGKAVSILAVARDITERKLAEKALRDSEEQFRDSLENAPDGVYMNDLEGNFLYGNRKCEEMIGYRREELIGKNFLQLNILPESSLARAAEILQENINGKSTGPDEIELIRKDGRIVPVEINSGILPRNGQHVVLAFARDISERRIADEKLLKSHESLKKALNDAINTMVKIVELRDPYTAGHQQKVADLATAIAGEMQLEDARIDQLRTAAIIHDIGKMYVPSDILSKPGRLSEIELGLIKTHSQNGHDIVKGMDFPGNVAQAVLQHHERLDGSGYPGGLKGEDTLLEAKILAVADVVEAMASHRPYRSALGIDKALEEISKNKGKLYDTDVVDACVGLFNSGKFEFKTA